MEEEEEEDSSNCVDDGEIVMERSYSIYSDKSDRKANEMVLEKQKSSSDDMIKISFTNVRFTVTTESSREEIARG